MTEPYTLTPEEKEIVLGGDCIYCQGALNIETNTCDWCGAVFTIRFFDRKTMEEIKWI